MSTTPTPPILRTRALLVPWTFRALEDLARPCTGTSWHDGDTCNVLVERGEGDYLLTHLRTAGYNAPELKGSTMAAGLAATAYVRNLADTPDVIYLDAEAFTVSHEEDDFGRMLATVTLADGRDLAQLMVAAGQAVPDP